MNEPMTARDALDAALRAADFQDEPYDVDAILAALPPGWTLSRDAIALGVAWAAVEAVLPEDGSYRLHWYIWEGRQDGIVKRQWTLQYERLLKPRRYERCTVNADSPTKALTALHAALLAREEGSR